ncbi:MAG: hypothetical protein HUJ90_05845, partial [Bacteroidales bacterium]|nr:hypothetical protein [Bacteroidales bacterium]
YKHDDKNKRETKEWSDLIQFVQNNKSDFDSARTLLTRSVATTQGAVHYAVDTKNASCIRTDELLVIVEKLISCKWDIEKELPANIPDKHLLYNQAALLKKLYPRVSKVVAAEEEQAKQVSSKIESYVGTIDEDNLLKALSAIQDLFKVFAANGIIGSNDIRTRYDAAPIDTAKKILTCTASIEKAKKQPSDAKKLSGFSGNALHVLSDFMRDLQTIAGLAEKEEANANKELAKIGGFEGINELSAAALETMKNLYEYVEAMEVSNATD